jgi:hypothetical protein
MSTILLSELGYQLFLKPWIFALRILRIEKEDNLAIMYKLGYKHCTSVQVTFLVGETLMHVS